MKQKTNFLQTDLQTNLKTIKNILPSEDILTYAFQSADGVSCALVYADGIVNKELLGTLVARPISKLCLGLTDGDRDKNAQTPKNSQADKRTEKAPRFPDARDCISDGVGCVPPRTYRRTR